MMVVMARCLLKAKGMPGWFLGEAANTTVYLLRWVLAKGVQGKTPFEAWHGGIFMLSGKVSKFSITFILCISPDSTPNSGSRVL
jgi:hypothetical protein